MLDLSWIKLFRKSKAHWLYQEKPFDRWHAWEDLLLCANHQQNRFGHGNRVLTVEKGQLVTSLRKLGERWGWNQVKVKRFLDLLQSDGMLQIDCNTKMTVITIAQWGIHQSDSVEMLHDCNTTVTQINTNKNVKNVENEKKKETTRDIVPVGTSHAKRFVPPSVDEVAAYCQSRSNDIDAQHFIDYYASAGWVMKSGKKMVDWQAAVRTWEKNGYSKPKKQDNSQPWQPGEFERQAVANMKKYRGEDL